MGGIVDFAVDVIGEPFGIGGRAAEDKAVAAERRARQQLEGGYEGAEERLLPIADRAVPTFERLESLITGEGDYDFTTSPGYQFRVDEGLKAIERAAAAGGALQSGGTLKALQERGQQLATSEYDDQLRRLTGLYGLAQPYYSAYAELPISRALQIAPSYRQEGNILAAQALRGGQQISSGITDIATTAAGGLGGMGGGGFGMTGTTVQGLPWLGGI